MKKTVLSGLFLSTVFVTSAMVHLPAQFVVQYAPLPNQLKLIGVEGTVWQGSVHQVKWQNQSYGALNWQLNIAKLFTGGIEAQVRFGRGSDLSLQGRGIVGYSPSGLYAENLIASLPVEQVLEFAPSLPVPLELSGQVELSLRSYAYAAPYCESAQGSVVWNTDIVGTPMSDLQVGPVIANFTCQQSRFDVIGQQKSDQVESGFVAKLNSDQSYTSSAWFKPQAEFPSAFQQQLKWLPTQADSEGKFQFSYQGRL
ncbi:type II secretion system protein N [Vibrio bivalvicida]|uniref:Type II secretion system protein N n=1 Tax=Vibrio bivalvicida TaxID=1276888 RepID=A0A177Y5G7_9VIBR|nr:type II secretion system protein N [Vibrio bivalvicida]OAJ96090.1 general secretion pathway protein GspN [Vibrio bivalvicida]